jgi:2-hydroxy-6-oxonona-2,4-dienedioate hydrolase
MSAYTRHLYTSEEAVALVEAWYCNAVEHLPVTCESRYVETTFGRTHILITGDPTGTPVVLLHGLNNNAPIWKPQLPALSRFHVHAVDIVGQPGRSHPEKPSLINGDYGRWLGEVLDGLGLERAAIVGVSMGAYITLKFGALMPERVTRAVLLSPAGLSSVRLPMVMRVMQANLPFGDFTAGMGRVMEHIFITPDVEVDADIEDVREFLEITARYQKPVRSPRLLLESLVAGLPLPGIEARRFTAPVRIITGDQDALFDAETVLTRAERVLPGFVDGHIIADSGHAMIYERSARVNELLVEFLALQDFAR